MRKIKSQSHIQETFFKGIINIQVDYLERIQSKDKKATANKMEKKYWEAT